MLYLKQSLLQGQRGWNRFLGIGVILCAFSVPSVYAQSTLDLPLNTGRQTSGNETRIPASPPVSRNSSSSAKPPRLPALPSRGASARENLRPVPKPAPKVLAQLGMVLPEKLTIRAGFDAKSQLLSVVAQGEHLAVVQEAPEHWGVLMVNNTVGWVPKSAIEMIDYRTEVTFANATAKSETAPPNPSNSVTQGNTIELDPVRKHILEEAFTYLGVPYVWAGNTRRGLDCSAFVKNVFATTGVQLPRHSGDQLRVGVEVQGPDLRPGDRLYFDMKGSGRINHTGIYIGNGMFIHASSNQGKVGVDSLFKKNYYKGLVAARRDFE